ncbi:MAG: Na+/H+ antiporter NhaC [Bacteroidaceae bacterium]|nr:Na+/H+ antiporter NhaC [Bacteroidaceae bacterium]
MKSLPPIWLACVPLVLLVALIACVVSVFGDEALSGASQIALLVAAACCVTIGFFTHRITWQDFEKALEEKISGISQAIIILLLIGALGSAWMVSGVVPMLIYYGLDILHPTWFLVSACVICAAVSVMTGSSWTTIATIGVALMGIGRTQGFSEGWIAGAIISGAYFGDKISPLSDTTVLASSTVGTPLFTHIHYMMYTTVPTFVITLIVFMVAGFMQGTEAPADVEYVRQALAGTFSLSPWLLLVPVLTAYMIARRMPSMVVLFLSTLLGCIFAVIFQGNLLEQIAGDDFTGVAQRFRGTMILVSGSTSLDTGVDSLNELVATKGMSGMLGTIWLIICAIVFGAAMTVTRMVDSIMQGVLRLVRNTVSMVASTSLVGIFLNVVTADQYLSIILTSSMFKDTYLKNGYEPCLLSRTTEDAVTVTSVLIPWNTCGMTQSSVLGVSTLAYLPYCFFNYLSPLMTIFMAGIGYKIKRGGGSS